MRKYFICLLVIILAASTSVAYSLHHKNHDKDPTFAEFVAQIRQEAKQRGVSEKTLDKYLKGVTPLHRAIHKRNNQPQKVLTFKEYSGSFVSPQRVKDAKAALKANYPLLKKIAAKYQVQPRFVVALWGVESDFGRGMGHYPMVRSLATLAYGKHRSDFYRAELLAALKILDGKHVIPEMELSSFDGGMGQSQFEPTMYFVYAVDFNGDGFKNIWTNKPDALASIANYLLKHGWSDKIGWGQRVTVPKTFAKDEAGIKNQKTIKEWLAMGVKPSNKAKLPMGITPASVLLPDGKQGPAYIVYGNFYILMRWNHTTFEQLSVGMLTDKLLEYQRTTLDKPKHINKHR